MAVVIIFLMTTTVARVFYLTIVRGEELSEKAETQQLKDTEITAMRGTIYDSNGNVLAQSASVWNVFIDPLNIKDKQRDLIVDEFANLFGYDADEKKEFYDKTTHQNHYELVEKKVENNIKEKLCVEKRIGWLYRYRTNNKKILSIRHTCFKRYRFYRRRRSRSFGYRGLL